MLAVSLRCPTCQTSFPGEVDDCPVCAARSAVAAGASDAEVERPLLERALAGRYRIERLLGRGGMGAVYLAWEHALERHVAIKVLPPSLATSIESRERFRREARTTAGLRSPNIVAVHAFGDASGLPYFVMDYVPGGSLAQRLKRAVKLTTAEACRILGELADALDVAHQQGVIHRDIKPENILLDATGRPMLADFGVATVSTSEHSRSEAAKGFGSPHYMSPEQAMGEQNVDGRSDLYALGVLGYVMLTGRLPFEGEYFRDVAAQHVAKEPPRITEVRPTVPDAIEAVILRCLAKNPADRWRSGAELRAALVAAQAGRAPRVPLRLRLARLRVRSANRAAGRPVGIAALVFAAVRLLVG